MAVAAPIAAAASIASIGFGVAGSIAQGKAAQSQYDAAASRSDYEAAKADRAAEIGRIQADQTDAQLREELASVISNIDSIRASSGIDPTSPTGIAIKDRETYVSDRDRLNKVTSIRLQAQEDERAAQYSRATGVYQRAVGRSALGLSYLNAAGTALKGISTLAGGMAGGGGGGSFNPGTIGGTGGGLGGLY